MLLKSVSFSRNMKASAIGGIVETVVTYPIETAKVRVQVGKPTSLSHFSKNMPRYYRGLLSACGLKAIQRVALFGSYYPIQEKRGHVAALIVSTTAQSLIMLPNEVSKTVSQGTDSDGRISQVYRRLYREGGVKRFLHGVTPYFGRNILFNSGYFLTEFSLKNVIDKESVGQTLGVFGVSSVVGITISQPCDVIKTHMQVSNQSLSTVVRSLFKSGGRSWFSGIGSRWLLMGVGTAIASTCREYGVKLDN
jgi:hypothetical protein